MVIGRNVLDQDLENNEQADSDSDSVLDRYYFPVVARLVTNSMPANYVYNYGETVVYIQTNMMLFPPVFSHFRYFLENKRGKKEEMFSNRAGQRRNT